MTGFEGALVEDSRKAEVERSRGVLARRLARDGVAVCARRGATDLKREVMLCGPMRQKACGMYSVNTMVNVGHGD